MAIAAAALAERWRAHMPDDEQARIGAYVRVLADALELKDWRFHIALEPCDDDCAAEIEPTYGQRHATISLNINWRERSPEEHRQTLVHELLHAHTHGAREVMDGLCGVLGMPAYQVASSSHSNAIEYAVEAIAQAIAPYLPLPNEGAGEAEEAA